MIQALSQNVRQTSAVSRQDEECFAWIDTLVSDYVYWYLGQYESERPADRRLVSRQYGKAWTIRFIEPRNIDAGLDHINRLVDSGLPLELLQSLNALVAQELKLFFLARTHEPIMMRLSQAKFVDLQCTTIAGNLDYCAKHS
jgi:hypothetical protein